MFHWVQAAPARHRDRKNALLLETHLVSKLNASLQFGILSPLHLGQFIGVSYPQLKSMKSSHIVKSLIHCLTDVA